MGIKRGGWYTVVRYNMRECEKRVKLDLKIYGWFRGGERHNNDEIMVPAFWDKSVPPGGTFHEIEGQLGIDS